MKKIRNSNKIKKQLGLSAAAVAGCAVGGINNASADIISTFENVQLSVPATVAGVYINLETGASGGSAAAVPGWDFNPYLTGTGIGFYWGGTPQAGGVGTATNYTPLSLGATVDGTLTYTSSIQGTAGTPFRTGGANYLGFRFTNAANVTNFGYALITSTGPNGFPATINGWRFENMGNPITITSIIPEPGVGILGALAMGAVVARRRRQVA